jgi:hypothetical protein
MKTMTEHFLVDVRSESHKGEGVKHGYILGSINGNGTALIVDEDGYLLAFNPPGPANLHGLKCPPM